MHILLNKSIFEPFWSLNRDTFPPKVIKNNYQSNIREYAGIFRMVEKYEEKFDIICNYKKSWYETKINCVNELFIKSNLICIEFYVHSTYKRLNCIF